VIPDHPPEFPSGAANEKKPTVKKPPVKKPDCPNG
jgi:hypothetical protein